MSDEEAMSGILKGKDAVVFWDAQDYPIHSGVDHESVFLKMKDTLWVCPKVSIHAYVKKLPDELRHKYEEAQIIIHDVSGGDIKANWRILVDLYLCSMRIADPFNLCVLSKHFTEAQMVGRAEYLYDHGFGVFLSEIGGDCYLPSNSSASFLTSLFTKREGEADTHADDLTLKSQTVSTNSSNSLGDFPSMANSNYRYAKTCIFLVMDDCSILDNVGDVFVLRKKLEKALVKKGYLGSTECWAHFLNKNKNTIPDYSYYQFYHCGLDSVKFNQGAGFDRVLADILCMASMFRWFREPTNLLIFSNNEKFREDTKLAEVCKCLKKKSRCNVAIGQIDPLIELVEGCGMEADYFSNIVTQIPSPSE